MMQARCDDAGRALLFLGRFSQIWKSRSVLGFVVWTSGN